jgi:hypothetical protein
MIDVYATDGTFADPGRSLAQRLEGTLMRIEELPALRMFPNNTAPFVGARRAERAARPARLLAGR